MFVKSNILRSPHAFATRQGGISENEHTKSLNLAFGRGDEDETVLKNLGIFARDVGFEPERVVSLPQIHSDRIFTVTSDNCGEGYYIRKGIESGDGYVTSERGVVLGIKTADCTPILFEAEKGGEIIAVGAVTRDGEARLRTLQGSASRGLFPNLARKGKAFARR